MPSNTVKLAAATTKLSGDAVSVKVSTCHSLLRSLQQDTPYAGHLGHDRTVHLVKQTYRYLDLTLMSHNLWLYVSFARKDQDCKPNTC